MAAAFERPAAWVALLAVCSALGAAEVLPFCPADYAPAGAAGECPSQSSLEYLLLQVNRAGDIEHMVLTDGEESQDCCGGCGNSNFCSPGSGNCYDGQYKTYYIACSSGRPACCGGCSGRNFCSPRSNNCYDGQYKDYYVGCWSGTPPCCGGCSGKNFCSPRSNNCYDGQYKDYYVGCSTTPNNTTTTTTTITTTTTTTKTTTTTTTTTTASATAGDEGAGPEEPGDNGQGGHRDDLGSDGGNTSDGEPAGSNACCSSCLGRPFCSPRSNNCYDGQYKDYYAGCWSGTPPCCGGCSGRNFCSPRSNNCYDGQYKDYYVGCSSTGDEGEGSEEPGDNDEGGIGAGISSHDEPAESFTCCDGCAGRRFCSPLSGSCYDGRSKPYYMPCQEANPLGFNLQTCRGAGDMRVKTLTYNLFWWNLFGRRRGNGGSAGRLVREAAAGDPFDVAGFQECDDPGWIMGDADMNNGEYDYVRWGSNTIAFRTMRWQKLANGDDLTSEDRQDQYYGSRGVQWIRLRDRWTGGTLFFAHTHGPLPVNTGGRYGGEATAWGILAIIYRNAEKGDSIVLTGDFNAEQRSSTVQLLEGRIHRIMTDWVDHIFTNCLSGVEQTRNLGNGGSDHDALMAVIKF